MTIEEKRQVEACRQKGHSFSAIAASLGLSINTVKSHCQRNISGCPSADTNSATRQAPSDVCLYCEKRLRQIPKQKPRRFCSEFCRRAWWRSHGNRGMNRSAYYTVICSGCEKPFESYGNSRRKYCGHDCYIKARYERPSREYKTI